MKELNFKTTEEIKVPSKIIDQVIGQDQAVEVIKKAAKQRRNVLLIGEPGTGKSMLGQSLAELLPKSDLVDVLVFPNPKDENRPLIRTVKAGEGKKVIEAARLKAMASKQNLWVYIIIFFMAFYIGSFVVDWVVAKETSDILKAADRISGTLFLVTFLLMSVLYLSAYRLQAGRMKVSLPRLLIDNSDKKTAPFVDATGSHEGALLGDILHDPLQSGGLGTPPHERVIAGDIHKAHKGVLFIDEIATLSPKMQIALLTAMQEKKMPITGRSERSSGAMTRTEPVPCDFILVAAGNLETLKGLHPALRSRIRGSGYEVYMNNRIKDTVENRNKLGRFVAQEVVKDGKIPHFTREAVQEIINYARKKAGRKGYLSIKFRELGGLIRAAGDIAREEGAKYVEPSHIKKALKYAQSLESQISKRYTEEKREYQVIKTTGSEIGRVNGLAIIGESDSGILLPIEAAVVPAMKKGSGTIIATGRLGKIAKEAVDNVGAIIKKYSNKDLSNYDIHIQFLQAYEGVEGDSASIAIATAVISALEGLGVKQDTAMTGSLSIRGEVLPVGGVNAKVEAAIDAGLKKVIIPKSNYDDVLPKLKRKIKIVPAETIYDVLKEGIAWGKDKKVLTRIKKVLR